MKNWLTTSYVLSAMLIAITAFAAPAKTVGDKPEDKSEKAWLAFKKKVETEVEKEVGKMFKDEIVFMKAFKDRVYKPGTTVQITRTIGRARVVKGLFSELKHVRQNTVKVDPGKLFDVKDYYAVISNTRYRLVDLDRDSALRLLYGGLPVDAPNKKFAEKLRDIAIESYVNSEVAKIEKRKSVKREQLKNDRYSKEGYNEMFFAQNILINGEFYSPIRLGIPKLILRVDIPYSNKIPCAEFKLQVQSPFDGIVVLKLGDKAISASSMNYTDPKGIELKKYVLSGYISKRDLGSNPAAVVSSAEVLFICPKIDSTWTAKAKGTTHPKNTQKYRTELIGFSLVKDTYGKVTSTVKVDLKSAIWNAKDYQGNRLKEMKVTKPKDSKPETKTPAPTN